MAASEVHADDRGSVETSEKAPDPTTDVPAPRDAAAADGGATTIAAATGAVAEAAESSDVGVVGDTAAAGSLAEVEAAAAAWFDRKVFIKPDFDASRYVDDMSPYVSSPRLPSRQHKISTGLAIAPLLPTMMHAPVEREREMWWLSKDFSSFVFHFVRRAAKSGSPNPPQTHTSFPLLLHTLRAAVGVIARVWRVVCGPGHHASRKKSSKPVITAQTQGEGGLDVLCIFFIFFCRILLYDQVYRS